MGTAVTQEAQAAVDVLAGEYPPETAEAARKWVLGLSSPNGLSGVWRLREIERRVSIANDGTRTERPTRLVRFAKGCPVPLIDAAEKYLVSIAPYSDVIVDGMKVPGVFRPVRTRWFRDDQTTVDDRRSSNENRYTLVQDLVEATEAEGDSVPQSLDCVEEVKAEYFWDEPSLPDASSFAHSQGVVVSVQQVSRQEDGTYRYAIVTRTAKTRVGAETRVECTAFRETTQQDFTNLYGAPPDFTDASGAAVSVPAQTCGTGGVDVQWRNLRQNDDCTWNLTVEKSSAKQGVVTDRTSTDTLTARTDTVKTSAQATPLEHVKSYNANTSGSAGHVWEQKSEKRPDGLYDNTVTQKDEKRAEGQVVEVRRTLRGTVTRTVNRHMPSKASNPAAGDLGTVVNTKTDSGRYDQEIVEIDKNASDVDLGTDCEKTIFEHAETEKTVKSSKPADHVANAGGGHSRSRRVTRTEEGGYEVSERDVQELPVVAAQKTYRKTLRGGQTTTVDRNMENPVSGTGLAIGETRSSEQTPGGRYNNSVTVTSAEAAGRIGEACNRSVTIHAHSTTDNVASQPASEATAPAVNVTTRKTARRNEEGTWDVEEETATHSPLSKTAIADNVAYKDEITSAVNQTTASATGGVNETVDLSASLNDHGSLTVTQRKRTHKNRSATTVGGTDGVTETTENVVNSPTLPMSNGGVNTVVDVSATPNQNGSYDYRSTTRRYTKRTATATANNKLFTVKTTVDVDDPSGGAKTSGDDNKRTNVSSHPNSHGSYDTSVTEVTPKAIDTGWMHWDVEEKTHTTKTKYKYYLRLFRNQNSNWVSSNARAAPDENLQVDASINEFGLLDGRMVRRKLVSWQRWNDSDKTGGYHQSMSNGKTVTTFWGTGFESMEARVANDAARAAKLAYGIYGGRTYVSN